MNKQAYPSLSCTKQLEVFLIPLAGIPVHLILTPTLLNYDTSDLKNSDPLGVKNTETLSV